MGRDSGTAVSTVLPIGIGYRERILLTDLFNLLLACS
jgi:hypothetical protein